MNRIPESFYLQDIKSDNCVVSGIEPHLTAKLIDFGLAKKFDSLHSNVPTFGPSAKNEEGEEEATAPHSSTTAAAAAGGAAAAANAAPVAVSNVPSTLFGRAKQCAPEVQMFSSEKRVFLDVVVFLFFCADIESKKMPIMRHIRH